MELNRIWHEPEVVIYNGVITPGIRCSGQGYDLANRRWYQINVSTDVYDEEWMADIIENHISTHHHTSGEPTPFNVINVSKENSLAYDTQPNHVIARPILKKLQYHPKGENGIPTVSFDRIIDKVYLGRAIDKCRWNDQDCAFKRIEFDCDIETIDREIKSREALLEALSSSYQIKQDANKIMEDRFKVLPILAVVVVEENVNNEVLGILMPFGGRSLESLSGSRTTPMDTAASGSKDLVDITRGQLRDLARGVRELAQARVVHGNINDRNTLQSRRDATAAEGYPGQNRRLVLIDFGEVAPEYKNDAFALDQRKIEDAAQVLKENGDFDRALGILDDETDR